MYWTPIVSDDIKPKVTSKFDSYGEAVTMYRIFSLESCFDVRHGRVKKTTYDIITNRHLVCNQEGNPNTSKHNNTQRRKDLFRRDCKVKVVLDIIPGTHKYVVSDYVEKHNHELFSKGNMYLSHTRRKLDYSHEIFINNLSKQNIGPVIAHRLYSALQGGRSVRGGLVSDFKNARRNLNCYIGGRDTKFLEENVSTFTFEYKVLSKRLNALFWADETTKYNYNSFGDVVSLGATFSMNDKEDGVSYERLLRAFLKAFRKQPKLMLSIEDPATNQIFRKRFHSIMWNSKLEPHDFENLWHMMLEEFKIIDNIWMKTMYGLRRLWIPSFFKHIPMSSLMQTTSLSESQKWLFQTTTLTGSYLIMFMMTFDLVMERQRHNQILNDFNIATTFPKFITRSPNEPHASKVQKEISRFEDKCFQKNVISSNGVDTIIVLEKENNITTRQRNDVVVDDKYEEYNYDCLIRDTKYTIYFFLINYHFIISI
uniref:FAR1 domain-containing protein n=1 Tax=Lactuca sativa TaxID=4236 RepID=A0A9R1WNI8_LACSA|nr:hypothetical protein LSAT_V11C100028850 [Lactuca sativa]